MVKEHDPITPGEILRSEFLEPLGMTADRLADATGVPRARMSEIIRGKRRITAGTALRLSRALGLSDRYWLTIQDDYDIEQEHVKHAAALERVEKLTRD
ncbi:HigA family addiction module antitoxin [Humibacter soli]